VEGLDAQREQIDAWADAHDTMLAHEELDLDVSDALAAEEDIATARPGMYRALAALTQHNAGVLVALSRATFACSVFVAMSIDKLARARGARTCTADGLPNGDTPDEVFVRHIFDTHAAYQYEVRAARERAAPALAARAVRHRVIGKAPYGYARMRDEKGNYVGVYLVPDPKEMYIIGQAQALRARGSSMRTISFALHECGYRNRMGRQFSIDDISRMCSRKYVAVPNVPNVEPTINAIKSA
jgi:DNA invertase Pin-like site-specific DNA recombinase